MNWRERLSESMQFGLKGWLGGLLTTVILGFSWPIIFPAIINVEHYYEAGPGLPTILAIVLAVVTPPSFIGGLIGGRVAIEGGARGQTLFAILFGIFLALPFTCMGLWFFTGY